MLKYIVFLLLFIFSSSSHAYIDPGSGSAIMSAVIGIFVAVGLAVKTYWYKLKSFFTRNKNNEQESITQHSED